MGSVIFLFLGCSVLLAEPVLSSLLLLSYFMLQDRVWIFAMFLFPPRSKGAPRFWNRNEEQDICIISLVYILSAGVCCLSHSAQPGSIRFYYLFSMSRGRKTKKGEYIFIMLQVRINSSSLFLFSGLRIRGARKSNWLAGW